MLTVGGTTPYSVSATLPGNSLLVLDVDADVLGSPLDSVVTVTGPSGTAENDNDPFTFDSALGVVTSAGSYTIQITDKLNRSGPSYFFLAKVLLLPLQPSGGSVATGAGANFLTVSGTLAASPWTTQVSLAANTVLTLDVDAQELGSPLDSVLEVVGPGGTVIASNDDDLRTFDSALAVRIPATGNYTIRITDFQHRTGRTSSSCSRARSCPGYDALRRPLEPRGARKSIRLGRTCSGASASRPRVMPSRMIITSSSMVQASACSWRPVPAS